MFTDRFIRVPIEMYNRKEAEITGDDNASVFTAEMKINPIEILSYRNTFDDNQNEENKIVVGFKNGDDIIILMKMDEFENLLNRYYAV